MNERERVDAEEGEDLRAHARSRRKRRADAQPDASQAHAPEPEPKDRRPSPDADPDRAPLDPIFPQLVRDPESSEQKLIGFLAFGLYEEARREWTSGFRDREGRYPNHDELRAYELSWTSSRLDGLRNSAVQLIAAYGDAVVRQVEFDVLRGTLKGRFWRDLGLWLLGATLFTLFVVGALIVLGGHRLWPARFSSRRAPPRASRRRSPLGPVPGLAGSSSPRG